MALVWMLARVSPGAAELAAYTRLPGLILIGLGVALMVWAVATMWRHRTTVIPHRSASALVTDGPFALSRNPIYLGDAMVLLGWAGLWGAVWGLLLLPAFVFIINRRFILAEEARLREGFGHAFTRWSQRVRRWL